MKIIVEISSGIYPQTAVGLTLEKQSMKCNILTKEKTI